jgi:tRNA-splicing ligase RtcB
MYYRAMKLAGRYAYAGRDYVIDQVLAMLGAEADFEVHNHHNYAWKENHNGREVVVVRKGATPSVPGQLGFIGGSMGDISVIVRGSDSDENRESFYSTVHGAGRIMSRTQAAGKMNWKTRSRSGGQISTEQMMDAVRSFHVELRGAGTDESPFVYRKLQEVLDAHSDTIEVLHVLKPIGVCMAGADEYDPYKD